MSDELLAFARDRYSRHIQEVFDDPGGYFGEGGEGEETPAQWVERMKRIGNELGLDYEAVVRQEATAFEMNRMLNLTTPQ